MATDLQFEVSYRQILRTALPISLALLVPQFNFVVNNIFLGHLNEQALATASITGVYYLIFVSIGYGLNNGLQMLISRRAGEDRPIEIGKIFNQGVLISMVIAAFGIIITFFIAPAILRSVLHSEETYNMAVDFLYIRILGLPFLYIYQMRNALLVGINRSKLLITGTLAEALANIFFDYTLIFGKLGFPNLGFNGAAIASVISEFTGMFVIFLVIRSKGITKRFSLFSQLSWNRDSSRLILNTSAPLIFQHAISIISWVFFYVLIEHHGATSLAVSNTMRNIFGLFGIMIWAFASTTNSMVSNVIGQGKKDAVFVVIKKIVMMSTGFALLVCLFLNLFPHFYLSLFGQSEEFIMIGIPVVRVVAFAMVIMSAATVWLYSVTGTGNSRVTFTIELITIIIYCIYVYIVLEYYKLSIFWGWVSELLYWALLFVLSYWYMKSRRWKEKIV